MSISTDVKIERIIESSSQYNYQKNSRITFLKFDFNSKHLKRVNYLIFLMIIGLVTYLFHLKSEVQDLSYEHRQLNSQLDQEKRQFNLLKAELAYLNSPGRLRALTENYLKLEDVKPNQLVMEEKNTGNLGLVKFAKYSEKSGSTKRRFRKIVGHSKNVLIKEVSN